MSSNKNIGFPYYSGNIRLSKCLGHVSLEYFINAHKKPKSTTIDTLAKVEAAEKAGDKAKKRELKQQLFSFTPSVFIPKGMRRKYENVDHWTGLMQLDFDKLRDEQEALDLKEHVFNNYKHIVTCYLSPSKKGVKALLRIKIPKDKKHYKALHKAVLLEMEQYDSFDSATTNAMLPLFLSMDKDILYRDYSKCYVWDDEDWEETEYKQLNDEKSGPHNFNYSRSEEGYYQKTVRLLHDKIAGIVTDGHPQVRSACLILGSRVGAGYIDKTEAVLLAENLIDNNGYLNKDLSNYKNTARWAIDQGSNNPKYYK